MTRFLVIRVLQALATFLGASILVFILVRLTGDPAAVLLPPETPKEAVEAFREANGLDQPPLLQYFTFLWNALSGDLGTSIRYRQPVVDLIGQRLPATFELSMAAIAIAAAVALPLGIVSGLRKNSWIDTVGRFVGMIGQSIPTFYLGILFIGLFSVALHILPAGGTGSILHLILPSVSLAFFLIPVILRVTRGAVLEVVGQDFIWAQRAKGLPRRQIVNVHVLRAAAIPVITVLGLQLGVALSGAIVTETVFSWPGIGQLLVNAISTRDFPVVQGIVLLSAAVFITINLLIDLIYRVIDPRIGLK